MYSIKYIFSNNVFDYGIIFSIDFTSLISLSVNVNKNHSKHSYGFKLLSFAVSTSKYITTLACAPFNSVRNQSVLSTYTER